MANNKIKIVFMGMPEFGAIVLEGLIKGGFRPILVITAPDKPVGRKQIITPPPVKVIAQQYKIPVIQPEKMLDTKYQIQNTKPDLIVVAAYGQILPKEILEIPRYGCLNVHPSLLPRWRGPSPIQYTILNGDKETGVTITKMTEKVDAGSIISKSKIKNRASTCGSEGEEEDEVLFAFQKSKITYPELHDQLAELGANLLVETIPKWIRGEIKPKLQDKLKATYTKILKKEDGKIDWQKSAEEIERKIRAFDPWPGTYTIYKGKRLKILKAEVLEGNLIIKEVQLEGKKSMSFEDFLLGHPDFIGTVLK